jgi:hypothetical protein
MTDNKTIDEKNAEDVDSAFIPAERRLISDEEV